MEITSSIPDVSTEELKQSPLLSAHLRLGGRMVPFAGWNMPVQYAGITQEHLVVRSGCGIFDISHMGEFFVSGAGAGAWLNRQLTNNTARLSPGEGQYTLMLNESGGVIDDLIVYHLAEDRWFLVVNASKIDEDREWLRSRSGGEEVRFKDESPAWAGMAVQGPKAETVFSAMTGLSLPPRNGVVELDTPQGRLIVCRTGYTGEDGFELFCPAVDGVGWWDRAIAAGASPCGLGARDTLRLEMCYPLNGNDLSPERTPLEAGLGFFVDLEKGDFTGRSALVSQKAQGIPQKLTAIRLADKSPPARAHYPVLSGGKAVGELCSGGVSPSMGCGIGMAYLPPELSSTGTKLEIDIRGLTWPVELSKNRFTAALLRLESAPFRIHPNPAMPAPANARFTASHEWILAGEEISPVGISDHAQSELGDIVYIELPDVGRKVSAGEAVAVIESVKAASDIYAPVAGEIVAVNEEAGSNTGIVNTDPHGAGWLFKIKPANPADVNALMDEAAYLASQA